MKRNVCGLDRTVRLTAGAALALVAVLPLVRDGRDDAGSVSRWRIVAAYAAAELLVTGLLQWCPGNYAVEVDTCEQAPSSAVREAGRKATP